MTRQGPGSPCGVPRLARVRALEGAVDVRSRCNRSESGDVVRKDWMVEYQSSRYLPAERVLQTRCDLDGHERVTPGVEKVGVLRHRNVQRLFPSAVDSGSEIFCRKHGSAAPESLDGRSPASHSRSNPQRRRRSIDLGVQARSRRGIAGAVEAAVGGRSALRRSRA